MDRRHRLVCVGLVRVEVRDVGVVFQGQVVLLERAVDVRDLPGVERRVHRVRVHARRGWAGPSPAGRCSCSTWRAGRRRKHPGCRTLSVSRASSASAHWCFSMATSAIMRGATLDLTSSSSSFLAMAMASSLLCCAWRMRQQHRHPHPAWGRWPGPRGRPPRPPGRCGRPARRTPGGPARRRRWGSPSPPPAPILDWAAGSCRNPTRSRSRPWPTRGRPRRTAPRSGRRSSRTRPSGSDRR